MTTHTLRETGEQVEVRMVTEEHLYAVSRWAGAKIRDLGVGDVAGEKPQTYLIKQLGEMEFVRFNLGDTLAKREDGSVSVVDPTAIAPTM